MKKLQLIKADVIPAKPESNTLYIIGDTIIAYSDNNSRLSILNNQEESQEVTIDNLPGVTAQGISIVKASTPQAVRTIIGAGTSNLAIGTTATTVKAGNYTPSATEIVTAINTMTPEQVTTVQTKLGITPTP